MLVLSLTCRAQARRALCALVRRHLATRRSAPTKELRFSETSAYYGRSRPEHAAKSIYDSTKPLYTPSYYDSSKWRNLRASLAFGSIAALIIYFAFIRESNDIDIILNAPPHLLAATMERRRLKDEIAEARVSGKDTAYLEAQLEYAVVTEAESVAKIGQQARK